MQVIRPVASLVFAGLFAPGCGSELSASSGAVAPVSTSVERVRTRPICGNAVVEPGEACDEGGTTPACDAHCQSPCADDALEIVGCGPGRTLVNHIVRHSDSLGRDVAQDSEIGTLVCHARGGDSVELAVCTDAVCLTVLTPAGGEKLCSPPCGEGAACPTGTTCILALPPGYEPPSGRDAEIDWSAGSTRCMPTIGGQVGDRCESAAQCGARLGCNVDRDDYGVCSPSAESCADAHCPEGFECSQSIDLLTRDPSGYGCFAGLAPLGSIVDSPDAAQCVWSLSEWMNGDQCDTGCAALDACGRALVDDAGASLSIGACASECRGSPGLMLSLGCLETRGCGSADTCWNTPGESEEYYCSRPCEGSPGSGDDCPAGFTCSEKVFGEEPNKLGACIADGREAFKPAPPPPAVRPFGSAACPDDLDQTCTFGSACDLDCERALGCGEVPVAGRCREDRVEFCDRSRVVSIDCAGRDLRCGYDDELARFDCLGVAP